APGARPPAGRLAPTPVRPRSRVRLSELPAAAGGARPGRDRLRAPPRARPDHRAAQAPVRRGRPPRGRQALTPGARRRVHPPLHHRDPRPRRPRAARRGPAEQRDRGAALRRTRPRGLPPLADRPAAGGTARGRGRAPAPAVTSAPAWAATWARTAGPEADPRLTGSQRDGIKPSPPAGERGGPMTSTSEAAFAARSRPSRLLEPGAAVTREELQLAARNHGLPLEMLCEELTPPGLHYVLTHFDIPRIDPAAWRLEIGGALARPVTLDLADLTRLPRRSVRVTLECAGNGRARLDPRPESQPWLVEAVGTAEWTGTPLAPLLHSAGLSDAARDVVFTGADHGVERGVEQDYQRGLPLVDALAEDVLIAYEMNSAPLPPQHGYPARLVVP